MHPGPLKIIIQKSIEEMKRKGMTSFKRISFKIHKYWDNILENWKIFVTIQGY